MLPINRVENELNQWRSKEERFSKLFSFSLSSNSALLKEKLKYYDCIAAKYKSTQDADERSALRMLRQERNSIEKRLYHNLLMRLIRRLLVAPVKEQIATRQDNRKTEENSRALRQQVQRPALLIFLQKLMSILNGGSNNFPFRFPIILMIKKS